MKRKKICASLKRQKKIHTTSLCGSFQILFIDVATGLFETRLKGYSPGSAEE